ncbi:hypothetical protein [Hyphomicrobium sp. D-2]|uniref:hypothetical protein n=1 Tax=Hyphomicrobium sp. D-2 TaxID=3041621 RepID=UPI002454857B|nr:hypothetical protein [Hyphomicrobium sp. D-2]MDH4983064.1 hypothetical protein [Hyphomicrobium sp. D-2]
MTIATVSAITTVGAIHAITAIPPIVPTAVVAVLAIIIASTETVMPLAAIVTGPIHTRLIIMTGLALMLVLALVHWREIIVAIVVTVVIALDIIEGTMLSDAAIEIATTLADLLFADGHDDAIIVLCVLQIILG